MCCTGAEAHGDAAVTPWDKVPRGKAGPPHTPGRTPYLENETAGHSSGDSRGEKHVVERGGLQAGACKGPKARACWCQGQDARSRVKGGGR